MVYLYAFVGHGAHVPDVPGIDGGYLMVVPLDAVSAVVAKIEGALEPTDEHVLAHARVVDAVAAANDAVLPARFGRGFRDLDDLERAAARLAPELEERLATVSGCVEIGLHVVAPQQPARGGASGREYMQHRLRDLARLEALAEDIHAPLAERARAATRTHSVGPTALLRAAYLVPAAGVESFRAAVEQAQRRHEDISFACTGPWAPYSFAAPAQEGVAA
jgi:hypothetical protein